ncbi:glutathione peroxidase [Marinimicrobium sp. ABcell2]|uniref:glutathione peroxidase n=1 Tax=Marinimicrobium sp. ABcell2 TaxID=3069751 RepID=UPI0027B113EF|nr:glutathione peroxidase [Marinimicrobium sp. ABcell2]MDQ2076599.1 glutathione peroxidase [Marinimicrobium sp. ABcell2]
MNARHYFPLVLLLLAPLAWASCPPHLEGEYRRLHSTESVDLCQHFEGRLLLVVNTASHCGFTRQFEGLEAVHQRYQDKGLAVVGFSSNDFNQEADSEAEAASVCYENFGVTFTMLAPTAVTGDQANPLFRELAVQSEPPGWNFNKYLLSPDGSVLAHFDSRVEPDSETVMTKIETWLNAQDD